MKMAERIFRRKIYEQMLSWKQNQHGFIKDVIKRCRISKQGYIDEAVLELFGVFILINDYGENKC